MLGQTTARSGAASVGARAALLVAGGALLAALAAPAGAQERSLAALRGGAQQASGELAQLQRDNRLDGPAQERLVQQLGQLVLGFIEQSERAAREGLGAQRVAELKPVFEAIAGPLNDLYKSPSSRMERMQREIMDQDGDLDALYESRDWQQMQTVAGQSLYYLNWLNYYGARLYDGARRKELLEAAEKGFASFALGDQKTDLLVESLLGRGLCNLELGNYDWAVRDFKIVIDEPKASAERKEKARVALLDAYSRSGKPSEALKYSQELLSAGGVAGGDVTVVRFYRLVALFDAMKGASGAQAESYRREAGGLMDQLRGAGPGWAEKVDALMLSRIDNPAQWASKADTPLARWELARLLLEKGDEKGATPLLEGLVASDQAGAKPYQAEANYWLGVIRFKAGDYAGAVKYLEAAQSDDKGSFAPEASYLRFKALEALMAAGPNPDLAPRYLDSMRTFLQRYPDHRFAYEVRYRLGESLQSDGQYDAAIIEYEQVRGDPGFELRAAFGTLQSQFEGLKGRPDPATREKIMQRVGAALDRFWEKDRAFQQQKDKGDVPVKEFEAKSTVLQAVYLSLRGEDGDPKIADALADYPKKYPQQTELVPEAVLLRLGALRRLGRFNDALQEVQAHGAFLAGDGRADTIEEVATSFAKAGAKKKVDDPNAAKTANQIALRLYELAAPQDGAPDDKHTLTLARLYENTEQPEQAEALYKQVLSRTDGSAPALRGLARLAEGRKDLAGASEYWKRYTAATRPGDLPWYEGQYEQARIVLARGDKKGGCALLDQLRPAMPGLSDADLRQKLNELYQQSCK